MSPAELYFTCKPAHLQHASSSNWKRSLMGDTHSKRCRSFPWLPYTLSAEHLAPVIWLWFNLAVMNSSADDCWKRHAWWWDKIVVQLKRVFFQQILSSAELENVKREMRFCFGRENKKLTPYESWLRFRLSLGFLRGTGERVTHPFWPLPCDLHGNVFVVHCFRKESRTR